MIEPETLERLLQPVTCGVSIYLPLEPNQRDQRAPEARLRGLIDMADAALERRGMEPRERTHLLDPVRTFAGSARFAQHRDPGLAIFSNATERVDDAVQVLPLPVAPPEAAVVGRNFHLKPLLPLMAANQRFNILALSKTNVRLLTATPFTWTEVPLETLPIEVQAELDARAEASGEDASLEDARRELLVSSPRSIATALKVALGEDPAPVVLVADPQVAGHFLQQVQIRQMHPQPLHLNPFALSDAELHAKVLDIIRPDLDVDLNTAIEAINARLGSAEPTVAIRLEEILQAAGEGRVDTVIVAQDEPLWGHMEADGHVVAHGTPSADDEDLLNLGAVLALRNGGRAFALPRAELPRQVFAAATLRF